MWRGPVGARVKVAAGQGPIASPAQEAIVLTLYHACVRGLPHWPGALRSAHAVGLALGLDKI